MRAVQESDVGRAWDALQATGRDPAAWMLMYEDAGRWAFKNRDSRVYVYVGRVMWAAS